MIIYQSELKRHNASGGLCRRMKDVQIKVVPFTSYVFQLLKHYNIQSLGKEEGIVKIETNGLQIEECPRHI